jgi:hypothetical protein
LRDLQEKSIMGGFKKIYPLDELKENEEKIQKYKIFLESALDQYDFFNNGRRKNGTFDTNVTYEKKSVRKIVAPGSVEQWRAGAPPEKGYIWEKPSKYQ